MSEKKESKSTGKDNILIVGLGASAGGLKPLKAFFSTLPEETAMAFIVIVHLAPDYESNMAELLQMQTALNVLQVHERVPVEAGHVYVIPPNKLLEVNGNHLELFKPQKKHGMTSIDLFFRSLGKSQQERAAGIILSGTGSGGTVGMKAIKEHGGLTIVQDPMEAEYSAMPRSAIDSGLNDLILPVRKMYEELLSYQKSLSQIRIDDKKEPDQKALQEIFTHIQSHTNHDFTNYKRSSVLRRIKRRMQVNHITNLPDYASFVKKAPGEPYELFKDLLISVTNFFRDKEAFEAFEKKIIPKLFEDKQQDTVRVWVPGCATGEEVYSIAILLYEYMQQLNSAPNVKIFGTDIDEGALATARRARYPESISTDVPSERLQKYFNKREDKYKIKKRIRDMVLFASHDLLRDPPFSMLDLLVCRNLLIYLNRKLQAEVFNLFHYALREEGYLFLGSSDSNLEASEFFQPLDKKNRLYRRTPTTNANQELPRIPFRFNTEKLSPNCFKGSKKNTSNFEALHQRLLVRSYAPQSVIINGNFHVMHATEGIKEFLEYSGGEPSHNVLEMIKPPLRQPLRSLLFQLKEEQDQPLRKKVQLLSETKLRTIELVVYSIHEAGFSDDLIQVTFKDVKSRPASSSETEAMNSDSQKSEKYEIIKNLEDELEYTKEQLKVTVEEYETSNEELRASNEELQSMNEELQSTTEELETSQEELQSVNEELKTVNHELENKVEQLARVNSDLKNLMESTEIGIMFIDRDLCVQRFTSSIKNIFNLIPSDKGRPLEHVTHKLKYQTIMDDIRQVMDSLQQSEEMVHSKSGEWYIMRIRPYRSTENKIEGVVLSFMEFTELKKAREKIIEQSHQESLATLGMYVLERDDLKAIMQRAIELSCIVLNLDCAVILALNKEKNKFEMGAHAGCAQHKNHIDVDPKWDIGYAMAKKEPTVVIDYDEEERFNISPYLEHAQFKSSINIIIRGTKDEYGLLGFYSQEKRSFTEHEINYIKVLANIVGMAIERTNNKKALEDEISRSKQYQREILNTNITKRWELGSYLHDNLSQMLALIKILVDDFKVHTTGNKDEQPEEITEINKIIDTCVNDIRNIAHDIIPIDVEEEGIGHALRLLKHRMQKLYHVNCKLKGIKLINDIKNIKLASNLYYIIEETIKNAATHGKAENIIISFSRTDKELIFRIKDDGDGFKYSDEENKGRGLRIIQYRLELFGGTFDLEENTDSGEKGMVAICTIPVEHLVAKYS